MKFDQFIEKANEFLREVAIELGTPDDTDHAYRVMTSVFHTIKKHCQRRNLYISFHSCP
jgi:uncharacterized protein (DUF2267 family)